MSGNGFPVHQFGLGVLMIRNMTFGKLTAVCIDIQTCSMLMVTLAAMCFQRENSFVVKILYLTLTHTHTFNGPFLGLPGWASTRMVKINLDFSEVRDSEWHWH